MIDNRNKALDFSLLTNKQIQHLADFTNQRMLYEESFIHYRSYQLLKLLNRIISFREKLVLINGN